MHEILSKNMFRHFLLLAVACRILCDPDLALDNVNYARKLLNIFFKLLPTFYGSNSQVMNHHNHIHIADDVEHMNMDLSSISAFPFENNMGKIKRKIKGRSKPLEQLVRRISEESVCSEIKKKKRSNSKKNYRYKSN